MPLNSMAFNLTAEQEQFFRTVLMTINNERKSALMQLLSGEDPKTISQVIREFKGYPNADPRYLPKQNVLSIVNTLSPLELVLEKSVIGESGKSAKAFILTEKGVEASKYAGFALERMAREFDQSIYPLLSTSNSSTVRLRAIESVNLIYLLEQGSITIGSLIRRYHGLEHYASHINEILNSLVTFKDGNGNPIPLIEVRTQNLEEGIKGYQWVRESQMPTTKSPRYKWKKLVQVLSSDPERIWTLTELMKECGYNYYANLHPRLERLEAIGNVQSGFSTDLAQVYLTPHGVRFISSLLDPIRGAIAGDPVSIGIIERNQPNPADVARVLGYYVAIKNRERAGEPVLYQMQQSKQK